jgi:tRNA dimethylallyltransferase
MNKPAQDLTGRPPLIIIVGPTAVGKTGIAIQLAEKMNGEIVSADSRLFYRGMDIGTAKPTPEERARVPHHLVDVANPDETWSLAMFQQAARQAIAGIHARGKLPFLVGGTGQYVRAVTEGWTPPEVQPDQGIRLELEKMSRERGNDWLHQKLATLDPQAAEKIDARNVRRTIRALEVILTTGRKFSAQRSQSDSPYNFLTIGLTRPRPELYARIDSRIEQMFTDGLVNEVRGLLLLGCTADTPSMSGIGYRECIQLVNGQISEEEAKFRMKRATRVYVRRQANWFKPDDSSIHWFTVSDDTVSKLIRLVHQSIDV